MSEQKPPGSFFRDSAFLMANSVFMFAVTILSGIVVTRGLGPAGKGIYSVALLFPSLLAGLGTLGLNTASIYLMNREPADRRPAVVGTALAYSVAAGLLLSAALAAAAGRINHSFLGGAGMDYALAAAPVLLLQMLMETAGSFFLAVRDIRAIFFMNALKAVLHLAILAALLAAGRLTPLSAILSQLAALAYSLHSLRGGPLFTGAAWDTGTFRRLTSFGLRQHVGTAAQVLNYRADMFISAALLSPYQVGLYSVSLAISELLWYIANAAGQVLYPKAAAATKEEADSFTPEVARHVFYLTLGSAAVIWAAAAPMTRLLFGEVFLPAVGPIKLLLPGAVLLSVSKILGSHLSSRGFPQHNSAASVISLVSSVTLCLVLIPRWDLNGAAAATSISYAANLSVMMYFFLKTSGASLRSMFVPQKGDAEFYGRMAARLMGKRA